MHIRIWLFCLLLLCLCVAAADDDDTTCSATKRCKNGCCNKSGNCGFGPDYCGTNCRSDCDRKAECNPGFGSKWAKNDKCPLNVCCSKHGYCGTTKEYCGSKKVKRPSCGKTNGVSRVVGYFEGWARTRPCEKFWPEQIPVGLYTHINFAFATIDPKTFEVKADKESDLNTYRRLMFQKEKDPELKVYLAVGGWTFNDPGPTEKTFSDLAASVPRQKAFMKSLLSFMSTHNFDGLDLDWEYPQAIDRGGREVDFANFPKFMASLKKMLDANDKGLTITLPASYWYLQHFDIKKLEKTVDFFNIIILQKARLPVQGPGQRGQVQSRSGRLVESEIDTIIKERNLKPQLDEEAAVKVATWGNQWVSFDDEETFKLKSEYAQSRCLGGVMVWAISHDTKDAKYSQALAKAVGRKLSKRSFENEEIYEIKEFPNEQCRWTNCKESCPKGWVPVPRSDGGARTKKGEMMWDETGCGGDGRHTFCCPKGDKMQTCGWYGFKNGKCTKGDSCPSDMVEIGSNQMYCHKKQNYESACCTTDTKNMKVYGTCEWGLYPNCDDQDECRNPNGDLTKTQVWARSASGSGGGKCNPKQNPFGLNIPGTQFRKLCCSIQPNLRFEKCEWYKDVGPAPNPHPNGFCRSGCPSDLVRVALDTEVDTCAVAGGKGGMARCCKTSYSDAVEVENPILDSYRSAMIEWIDNPTCPSGSSSIIRRADQLDVLVANTSLASELVSRDDGKTHDISFLLAYILRSLMAGGGTSRLVEASVDIWDDHIVDRFRYLRIQSIKEFLGFTPQWETDGPDVTADRIICSPYSYNARVRAISGGGVATYMNCTDAICDKNGVCPDGDDNLDEVTRNRRGLLPSWSAHLSTHRHHLLHTRQAEDERVITVTDENGENDSEIDVTVFLHPTVADLPEDHPALDATAEYHDPENCADATLSEPAGVWYSGRFNFQTEHPIDKQIMLMFFGYATTGRLRSNHDILDEEDWKEAKFGPVPIAFYNFLMELSHDAELLNKWPDIPDRLEKLKDGNLFNRIMDCLGSKKNNVNFVVTYGDINWIKGEFMGLKFPIARAKWRETIRNDPMKVLARLRAAIVFIDYMNSNDKDGLDVFGKTEKILNNIVQQIMFAENLWDETTTTDGRHAEFAQFMIEWLKDYYGEVSKKALAFINGVIPLAREYWESQTGDEANQMLEKINRLSRQVDQGGIKTEWEIIYLMDDDPVPDPPSG
ncbi:hypothetical protein MRS44_007126 [Fusarium solani]|uniref:uncharacterized protein n=1 Tax=Fusarium solani TaxID=169388 RepID=UPI0032C44397|nr:hypothetical protein MRS44_007126 [Fusarium solani]